MTQRDEREKMLGLADRLAVPVMNKTRYEARMLNGEDRDLIVAALRAPADGEAHAEIQRLLDAKRRALAVADERAKENIALRAALVRAMIALDDWLNICAPDLCDDERVREAQQRISERGTLWYIANIQEQNRAALSNAPPASEGVREVQDIRWAVNVLLEKIAEKFEGWDTHDIWRSDAAMCVRGFKHTAPEPAITTEQLDKAQFGRVLHARPEPADTPDEGPDPLGYAKGE